MKGMMTVLSFTFRDQVRKKSYIISTIVIVVLIIAALCVPAIINAVQSATKSSAPQSVSKSQGTFYVIDNAGLFADKTALDAALTGYAVDIVTQEQESKIIDRTKSDSKISLVVVQISGGAVSYDYYVKSEGNGPSPDMLSAVFKSSYSAQLLSENGVKSSVITSVLGDVKYNVHQTGKGMMSGFLPSIAVSILLFMCIYMYGYWVAMSIASEKTSRVMELLITSTKPSKIVIGKSIAMGLLGLLQLLIIIAASVTTYKIAYPKDFNIGGLTINFSGFTPFYAGVLIVYFVLGFALYAMINAVAGATVSNAEDVRTAILPVSVVAMIAFYFAYGTNMVPDSTASVAASIIPFSAPFSMPSRILMADVSVWQMALSIGLLAVTTVLMAWISIRLYSSAVLHYGRKLKISELIAMSKH
jgi:ABC-2 type transport system permease protein